MCQFLIWQQRVNGSFSQWRSTCHLHILNPLNLRPELVTPVTSGSPLIVVNWHAKLNQIVTGSANAETHVLYNPVTSFNGAKTVMSRAPKRRHLDDDPNFTTDKYPSTYAGFITYMASKKLAEKAAWDFYENEKPSWSLATVNPTYIGGPNVLPLAKGVASLSFSQGLIWNVAISTPEDQLADVDFPYWVDVRDVAKAHLLAEGIAHI